MNEQDKQSPSLSSQTNGNDDTNKKRTPPLTRNDVADQEERNLLEMMMQRLERINNGHAAEVDEEEMESHPLLPHTSLLHYFSAPATQDDFPGYKDTLVRWQKMAERGFEETRRKPCPVLINYVELLNINVEQERQWRGQNAFTELVMAHPTKDIIGYWYQGGPRLRTLDILCSRTAYARMLTRQPHPQLEFHHRYEELTKKDSRLAACIQQYRYEGKDVSHFYMVDFTPADVFKVRTHYPHARIIGITVPGPTTEAEIVKILVTRQKMKDALKQTAAATTGSKK